MCTQAFQSPITGTTYPPRRTNRLLPPAFALACYSRSSGPFPWFKAITPEIDGRQAFSAERRLAVGEAAGRSTSPRAAPKARPPGPRGDISVAPSGTVSCPRQCLTSAPCSVRPPVPESPASAERRSDEQPPLDTPRRDPNSPAQEGPEDSDHEQALAGSKPRRCSDQQRHAQRRPTGPLPTRLVLQHMKP